MNRSVLETLNNSSVKFSVFTRMLVLTITKKTISGEHYRIKGTMVYTYNTIYSVTSARPSRYLSRKVIMIVEYKCVNVVSLGRKTEENYFADACTISKYNSCHIM
jgi:hypothetical protein